MALTLASLCLSRRSLREKDRQLNQQDKAIRELSVQIPSPVLDTRSTQTEVDDDGLWDAQVDDAIRCLATGIEDA